MEVTLIRGTVYFCRRRLTLSAVSFYFRGRVDSTLAAEQTTQYYSARLRSTVVHTYEWGNAKEVTTPGSAAAPEIRPFNNLSNHSINDFTLSLHSARYSNIIFAPNKVGIYSTSQKLIKPTADSQALASLCLLRIYAHTKSCCEPEGNSTTQSKHESDPPLCGVHVTR